MLMFAPVTSALALVSQPAFAAHRDKVCTASAVFASMIVSSIASVPAVARTVPLAEVARDAAASLSDTAEHADVARADRAGRGVKKKAAVRDAAVGGGAAVSTVRTNFAHVEAFEFDVRRRARGVDVEGAIDRIHVDQRARRTITADMERFADVEVAASAVVLGGAAERDRA
jgi:hypothetical protein